ncbi:terminase gpP N-terminus-related DNA-binding protein [Methylocystis parvus]|uniref:terminase gpP N-terminus-related DNA-binding protein n=1 Tax=Methylocystis parvus TaxID=134 RepID=UPI003C76FCA5
MSAFNTRDVYRERPREPGAAAYNRSYWRAVVATMGGGQIDALFEDPSPTLSGLSIAEGGAAFRFRMGWTVPEIASHYCRSEAVIRSWLDRARARWRRA